MSTLDELQRNLNYLKISSFILKAVYLGIPVNLKGFNLALLDNIIVVSATKEQIRDKNSKRETVYLPFTIDINTFLHWCYQEYENNNKWFNDIKLEVAVLIALNPKLKGRMP